MQVMLDTALEFFKKRKSNQMNMSINTQQATANYGNEGPRLACCNVFNSRNTKINMFLV